MSFTSVLFSSIRDVFSNKSDGEIAFAGDYTCPNIILISHDGMATDIKSLVLEMNIYEGINKNSITGTLVIGDTQNLISKLPIQGTERLVFKLSTPSTNVDSHAIDATEKTGNPFYIYKLTDKNQISPGTVSYILHFASREFMRNQRVKVSQSYNSAYSTMVGKIFKDKNYLDSRKKLFFEYSQVDKMVIPNLSPFNAISLIANSSIPAEAPNGTVGYYFYETTKGFHFRSWTSMVSNMGYNDRPVKQVFYYQPKEGSQDAVNEKGQPEDKIINDFRNVESYEFINQFHDVAANTAMGTYGHRVITHNMFDKSYNETDYNYHDTFARSKHADSNYNQGNNSTIQAIVKTPVDFDDKAVSDYPESRVSLQPSTRFLHDSDKGNYGFDAKIDGKMTGFRAGQRAQVASGTKLRLVVRGQSYLEPGDLIQFNLRNVDGSNQHGVDDPQYSGRYVITKIRHIVNPNEYKQVLECVKDSVKEQWPGQVAEFPGRSSREGPELINIYQGSGQGPSG